MCKLSQKGGVLWFYRNVIKKLSHLLILRGLVMCRLREPGLDNLSSSCFVLSKSSKSLKSPEQTRKSKAEVEKS